MGILQHHTTDSERKQLRKYETDINNKQTRIHNSEVRLLNKRYQIKPMIEYFQKGYNEYNG